MSDHDDSDLPIAARQAVQSGHKFEAFRILRERTGMSLAEAKAAVDRASGDRRQLPRLPAGREDSGTWRLIAVLVVIGAIAAAYLLL